MLFAAKVRSFRSCLHFKLQIRTKNSGQPLNGRFDFFISCSTYIQYAIQMDSTEFKRLKELIKNESNHGLPDGVFARLLDNMQEIRLKANDVLTKYGKTDDNLYLISSGIIRCHYFDGENEKIYGFAAPGSIITSYHSFYAGLPSIWQTESCGNSVVLKTGKDKVEKMIHESHEFAIWMLSLSLGQLFANEMKLSIINGSAKEKYKSLIENRPEIAREVQLKDIAAYLGVTPAYLSRLRKKDL